MARCVVPSCNKTQNSLRAATLGSDQWRRPSRCKTTSQRKSLPPKWSLPSNLDLFPSQRPLSSLVKNTSMRAIDPMEYRKYSTSIWRRSIRKRPFSWLPLSLIDMSTSLATQTTIKQWQFTSQPFLFSCPPSSSSLFHRHSPEWSASSRAKRRNW